MKARANLRARFREKARLKARAKARANDRAQARARSRVIARLPIAIALLVGVVLGSAGSVALCNSGYCGDRPSATSQEPEASITAFGAGNSIGEATAPMLKPTPSSTNSTAATASGTVAMSPTVSPSAVNTGTPGTTTTITGLAIIGDSTQDEYRGSNPRGGEYGDSTFNWVELLAGQRDVNLGEWGDRPEPRREGYAYNWARSGATTATMIDDGQHTGVAQQMAMGQVSHSIIQIGLNDFYYDDVSFAIYEGRLTGENLRVFLDVIIANVETAVRTVKVAGNNRIILAAMQDYVSPSVLPESIELLPDAAGRQRLIGAFAYVNQGLSAMAVRENVPFFDFNAVLQRELETRYDPTDRRFIIVGGARIDLSTKGDEPTHAFLGDGYAHPGTVFSGLMANVFIEQMNAVFGAGLAPFSDDEILRIAGLR